MEKQRVTLDSSAIVSRVRTAHPMEADRSFAAPRMQRQLIRRASIPRHRQPRVRLGKPTGPNAYVHWQDYLDIADLHRRPKVPVKSTVRAEVPQHESVSEMFNRYRHIAETVNEKINTLMHASPNQNEAVELVSAQPIGD